eukprot:12902890-Prorocentrum_lima.AAC.1
MQQMKLQYWRRRSAKGMNLNDLHWLNTGSCKLYKTQRTRLPWSNQDMFMLLRIWKRMRSFREQQDSSKKLGRK